MIIFLFKMNKLEGDVTAFQKERIEELKNQDRTSIYETKHDFKHEPWKASTIRPLLEDLAAMVSSFGNETSDFMVRKSCLKEERFLKFQRDHPQLYYLMTDRKMLRDDRFRQAFTSMLFVREKIDSGSLSDGTEADGMIMNGIVSALQTSK